MTPSEVSRHHRQLRGDLALAIAELPTWALWVVWAVVRGLGCLA